MVRMDFGNQNFTPPKGKPVEQSAADFLVEQAKLNPEKVTVVALGPLTNIALATQLDPAFAKNIGQIILLGAFAVNGNVNSAAEANIFGDPDAADIVFRYFGYGNKCYPSSCLDRSLPSRSCSTSCSFTFHLHRLTEGVVRVQTNGITRGLTILYNKQKRFGEVTVWCDKPTVKVAVTVDAPTVVKMIMTRLMDS